MGPQCTDMMKTVWGGGGGGGGGGCIAGISMYWEGNYKLSHINVFELFLNQYLNTSDCAQLENLLE